MTRHSSAEVVSEIISEFSDAFAFSRSRWSRFATEVSDEISGVNMLVLQIVLRKGPITATDIAALLEMDKSLVSRQVARLRELDLIETTPSEEDRRVHLLGASTHAMALIDAVRERWAHSYHERFAGWTPEELETLRAGLHRFNAAAEATIPDSPASRCARQAADEGDTEH